MPTRKNMDGAVQTRQKTLRDSEQKKAKMKKEILELMELKGWTQAQLAHDIGVSESAVWRWIEGERSPGGATLTLLRKMLDAARAEATVPVKQTA